MISISDKHNCCGCSACVQVCPKQCISFDEDEQGFLYPHVDEECCIDCGLCEKVCPYLNQNKSRKPLKALAVVNPSEDVRLKSSSGGIFTILAESIINKGGVVFGARFDEKWEVVHDYVETKEGLEAFRGAKYVQSRIGETYNLAKVFLNEGRKVLYTGTPCQISGLLLFLRKEYENLFCVEIACHGVPSPLAWRTYVHSINICDESYCTMNFRDKKTGWRRYSITIASQRGKSLNYLFEQTVDKNTYMQAFINNMSTRLSCANCPSKLYNSSADVTIGDFWGISRMSDISDDDKGTSVIFIHNPKVWPLLEGMTILKEVSIEQAIAGNESLLVSGRISKYREDFWRLFKQSGFSEIESILRKNRVPVYRKVFNRIVSILKF